MSNNYKVIISRHDKRCALLIGDSGLLTVSLNLSTNGKVGEEGDGNKNQDDKQWNEEA